MKLVRPEAESGALAALVRSHPDRVSSALATVEVGRAAARVGQGALRAADRVLRGVSLIRIDQGVLNAAAVLAPAELGSPDAVHLATALSVASDLEGFVTYDDRLGEAAAAASLEVLAPA